MFCFSKPKKLNTHIKKTSILIMIRLILNSRLQEDFIYTI